MEKIFDVLGDLAEYFDNENSTLSPKTQRKIAISMFMIIAILCGLMVYV